ncbi:MAG: peptidoglycan DD-metalloendopeptidase family protein [Thiobacillus sp.]|nr:peptidoglycan DD-metalloendopeptidase family protein [Thiobacillus sp.]
MSGRVTVFPIWAALLGALLALAGCTSTAPAPVSERTATRTPVKAEAPRPPQIAPSTTGLHTVQRGDTLYAIAFANGLDHREVANWNQLESADRILVGQVLRLTPPPGAVEVMPLDDDAAPSARPLVEEQVLREPQAVLLPYSEANWAQATAPRPPIAAVAPPPVPAPVPAPLPTPPANAGAVAWMWPAGGTVLGRFGAAGGKGIDIAGERNAPVVAIAPGTVVYSGSGLRGYGRLLIVKHADEYLSAYAHNESILVKEGDTVAAGQKIALMGDSDADRVKLHFEIRRYGKPLDPLNYLPERS